jgi:hypothetical protein
MPARARAICQVCGCEVPIKKDGLIAKHHTCTGSGHRPFPAYDVLEIEFQKAVAEFNSIPYAARDVRASWFRTRPLLLELGERLFNAKIADLPTIEQEDLKAEFAFVKDVLGFGVGRGSLPQLLWRAEAWAKYGHCRVCGKEVSPDQFQWALKRFEQPLCAPPSRCREIEIFKRYGCCDKARMIPCVCMHSFECPEHGTQHVGTHD